MEGSLAVFWRSSAVHVLRQPKDKFLGYMDKGAPDSIVL